MTEWTSQFPALGIDTPVQMPDTALTADPVFPSVSVAHAMRSALWQLQGLVGSDLLEAGSIRRRLSYLVNGGDIAPVSPSAWDDEFRGPGLDPKWSWARAGAPAGVSGIYSESWGVQNRNLYLITVADTEVWQTDAHCLAQLCPLVPWTASCKMLTYDATSDFPDPVSSGGLWIDDGTDTNILLRRYIKPDNTPSTSTIWREGGVWAASAFARGSIMPEYVYLRLQWTGTELISYSSPDGVRWVRDGNKTPVAWSPVRFGLFAFTGSNNAVGERLTTFKWFRVTTP